MVLSRLLLGSAAALVLGSVSGLAQPMIAAANVPGVSAALSAAPPYSCRTSYFVDADNGRDTNPGTRALPWKTIQNADNGYPNTPKAGECVNVLPGTYSLSKTIILGHGGNSNSPLGYVVYRSTVPQRAHLLAADGITAQGNGDLIMVNAPYIVIDGFDVDGNKSLTNGHGIDGCVGGGTAASISHHFVAINNWIHDMGGAGLSSCTADYITWRNNVVYNTSSTNPYQASGLAVWKPQRLASGSYTPTDWDNVPFKIEIAFNIVHDNAEGPGIVPVQGCTPVPPADTGPPCYHTDGNGIIIDTTFGSATCPTCGKPYPDNILVLGNVSYRNGGGGVHIFLSKNVIVANNTVYNNYLDALNPGRPRGELSSGGSMNITWVNNLAIAVTGSGVLAYNRPIWTFALPGGFQDGGTWTKNLIFGAGEASDLPAGVDRSTNLLWVDPKLVSPAKGNFLPLPGSPVIKAGVPEGYLISPTPNIGAY